MLEKGIPLSWNVLRLTFASLTSALDRSKMFAVVVPSALSKNFTHGALYIDTWISNPRKNRYLNPVAWDLLRPSVHPNQWQGVHETSFFSNISVELINNKLTIVVEENAIVNSIIFKGEKAEKYKEKISEFLLVREKSSYVSTNIKHDVNQIKSIYRMLKSKNWKRTELI